MPVRHGLYQFAPEGWTGATEEGQETEPPGGFPDTYPVPGIQTTDLAVAREFRYWREPALPDDWTLQYAERGGYRAFSYDAYCAYYVDAEGSGGAEICGDYVVWKYPSSESSWLANGKDGEKRQIVHETRVIAGRPALVTDSPLGQHHYALATIEVRVYDPATQTTYYIYVGNSTMRGADVDATIALAASLLEPPNPP